MGLRLDFVGRSIDLDPERPFVVGREGDLIVDDENQFLHRRFLSVTHANGVWLLTNVGDQLAATVSDTDGRLEAFLGPGAVLPIVFAETTVRFTAGPTTYDFTLHHDAPAFVASAVPSAHDVGTGGDTTIGRVALTIDQQLLVLALAESGLSSGGGASAVLPTSAAAARRLGWTTTKFNRKLDNVCDKLSKLGVRGLQGDIGGLASNRRARLVEYALAVRLVTRDDLVLLDRATNDDS
ncbi:MAG: hypothetical protein AB8G26_12170 [Ilumatobacter sp.]